MTSGTEAADEWPDNPADLKPGDVFVCEDELPDPARHTAGSVSLEGDDIWVELKGHPGESHFTQSDRIRIVNTTR